MKKIILLLILITTFLGACSTKDDRVAEARKLFKESMKAHDEVMPLMDEMYSLEGKLKLLRDSLLQDSTVNTQQLIVVRERLSALEIAGKAMMDWMHNIREVPGEALPSTHSLEDSTRELKPDAVLEIQQKQREKIEIVRQSMESSINNAKGLLKK